MRRGGEAGGDNPTLYPQKPQPRRGETSFPPPSLPPMSYACRHPRLVSNPALKKGEVGLGGLEHLGLDKLDAWDGGNAVANLSTFDVTLIFGHFS